MKYFLITLLSCTALFFACRKNMDEIIDREIGPILPKNVEAALVGRVVDANGVAVPNASVGVAGFAVNTNSEGLFFVPTQLLDNNGTLVRVNKSGYFESTRFAFPHLGGTAFIEIQMIPKNLTASFNAATGGTIDLGQGATVTIPANAIKNQFGSDYQGNVDVYAVWLDPSSGETFRRMPGDLRGINAEGEATLLRTFGMVGVELEGDGGQKLNLIDGKKAKLVLPVPASLQGAAPSNIPLWHFNTYNGYWEEEGSANLVNSNYEGEVSHFSFWNVDKPGAFVKISTCFANDAGAGISGLQVTIVSGAFGQVSAYADNNGFIDGFVPVDETLTMIVKDRCGNTVYQSNIGPFSEDTNLGKITITGLNTSTVTGVLLDCNNQPVQNGVASLAGDGQNSYFTSTNSAGEFSFTFVECFSGNDVTVIGYNFDDQTRSAAQTFTLPGGSINIGNIVVCTTLDEYITFSCNGVTRTFVSYPQFVAQTVAKGTVRAGGPGLPGSSDSTLVFLKFMDYNAAQNTATVEILFASFIDNNLKQSYGCDYCTDPSCSCSTSDVDPVVFSSFPVNVGDYAEGTVSGKVLSNQDKLLYPFTITFRVIRKI